MSGRRVRMPSLCQCNTCSSRRSRKETRSSAAVNQNTQRLRPALSSRPNPRSPSPRPTARSQPAPLSRPAPSANDVTGRRRSSVESESPALVAKVSLKWKGWQTMSNLENEHWKLVVTILALLVREAPRHQLCSFFEHRSKGGGGVISMFKKFGANFV